MADATEVGRREERMEVPTTNSTGTIPDARPGDSRRIGRAFGRAGVAGDPRGVPKAGFRVLSAGVDAAHGKHMETHFLCGVVKPSRKVSPRTSKTAPLAGRAVFRPPLVRPFLADFVCPAVLPAAGGRLLLGANCRLRYW